MNSKERVLATINHEEPDRVPIFLSTIDSRDVLAGYLKAKGVKPGKEGRIKVRRIIPGSSGWLKFLREIGIDLHCAPVCLFPIGKGTGFGVKKPGLKTPPETTWADEYGRVFNYYKAEDSDLRLMNYVGGMFDSETGDLEEIMDRYEKWDPLNADIKERYSFYKTALKIVKDKGPYILPGIGGFFEVTWESFGFENYSKLLFEHPDFIEQVTKNNEEFSRRLTEILIDKFNIEMLWVWDDLGYKTGPFINPRQYNKLIYPRMKSLVKFCHKNGVKVALHSCGNLNKILDKVIDTGIDALNPIEPSAHMDIFQIKKDYKNLTLIGNLDTTDLLTRGTPEQVEAQVKKLIKFCAPGGGYIVGSGHSINPSITYENYNAMIQATLKYGEYPIKIIN
ncbi:MAG: hypothetical protein HWN67_11390 [Candidatus Helarchaeota archaeon]|nr:hypothetical protein [Candidatus Helarchaeota archaeon]